jgi:alpha-maltose-1-phosphate synthase
MIDTPRLLTVITPILGNLTYGNLIKKYLSESNEIDSDFFWTTDDRIFLERLITRPCYLSFPSRWVQRQNLDLRKLRSESGISYITRSLISRKLRREDYSVLHLHTQSIGLLSVDLMQKVPTVVSLDSTAVMTSKESTDPRYRWTYKPSIDMERRVFDAAACIVTFSEFAKQSVVQDYDVCEDKVFCIHPGVDIEALTYDDSQRKARVYSGAVDRLCKILFIGGDFKRKGGEDLLAVFLENFADIAELHLVTQVEVSCDHPNVHVHYGVRPYTEDWLRLYQDADIFVMPTYAEALGHVFAEAMAMGLPVISSNLPTISDVVLHTKTGFLIGSGNRRELNEQLNRLISNPGLRYTMGYEGFNRAKMLFDAKKNFSKLTQIWKRVSALEN